MGSPKQRAFMRVRLVAKIEGITYALDCLQRLPYPEAVERLHEKRRQCETEWSDVEKERNA